MNSGEFAVGELKNPPPFKENQCDPAQVKFESLLMCIQVVKFASTSVQK